MKETTDNLLNKMLIATKATSPRNLSKYLEISPQAIYKAIKKNKISCSWINKISNETGYAIEWFYETNQIKNNNQNTTYNTNSKDIVDVFIPIVEARSCL